MVGQSGGDGEKRRWRRKAEMWVKVVCLGSTA